MKILQISMGENFGGIESLELNLAKYIEKEFQLDFLVPNRDSFKNRQDEIEQLEGKLYHLNTTRKNIKGKLIYLHRLYCFFKKHQYDIIHINSSSFFFSFQVAFMAKLCHENKIIAHAHSLPKINLFKRVGMILLNPIYRKLIDGYLSCSNQVRRSLFTKRFINKNKIKIIKNGIEVEKFRFNPRVREEYRKKLGLDNSFVLGNVSRFEIEKNHTFLIDIFYEIQKIRENSILLLIGDGKLKKDIQAKVKKLHLSNKVICLGFRNDINQLLNCMDVFILPSLREGFGTSVIEAQANGLPVYCSNRIPNETKVSSNFQYFNLKEPAYHIAQSICDVPLEGEYNRENQYLEIVKNEYDIVDVCHKLEKIYREII